MYILTFYCNIFVEKCKIEGKKADPYFPIFGVDRKRANKHLFFFLGLTKINVEKSSVMNFRVQTSKKEKHHEIQNQDVTKSAISYLEI